METIRVPGLKRPPPGPFSITSQQNSWPKTVSAPFFMWLRPPTFSLMSIM